MYHLSVTVYAEKENDEFTFNHKGKYTSLSYALVIGAKYAKQYEGQGYKVTGVFMEVMLHEQT